VWAVVVLTAPLAPHARHSARPAGRGALDVLILDAEYRQALAALRSLSRSGLRVGAVACQSEVDGALAFKSRWCQLSAVAPDFSTDPTLYVESILGLLDRYAPDVVIPCHDGSIQSLRARRVELESKAALPLASDAALDIAASKPCTLALAAEIGIAIPRSVLLSEGQNLRAALKETGSPAVIKPVESWVARNGVGSRLGCEIVSSYSDAERIVEAMQTAGSQVLIQQWLPGRRDAVTLFYARGQVWARFAQTSYRELPLIGGASVLCESLPQLPDLVGPAERLVRAMDLEGCSMWSFDGIVRADRC
jgi:biotin carboxylase